MLSGFIYPPELFRFDPLEEKLELLNPPGVAPPPGLFLFVGGGIRLGCANNVAVDRPKSSSKVDFIPMKLEC